MLMLMFMFFGGFLREININAYLFLVFSDNFEPHNSLKLSFTNIRGVYSNFVECESFLESNFPNILALREMNADDSIDSGNFSERDYLPLI